VKIAVRKAMADEGFLLKSSQIMGDEREEAADQQAPSAESNAGNTSVVQ
jgi:hypothetical protein